MKIFLIFFLLSFVILTKAFHKSFAPLSSNLKLHAKKVSFNDIARQKVVDGINIVADAVKITLGPKGKNVLIEKASSFSAPDIINDGATIARSITLEDPEMNVGARLLAEVAKQSDSQAGDGTTTSSLLTQEFIQRGIKYLSSGSSSTSLRKGMTFAAKKITEEILKLAQEVKKVEDVKDIAIISSGDNDIGNLIGQAYSHVGEQGSILIEESQSLHDELRVSQGMVIENRGYLSPYFAMNKDSSSSSSSTSSTSSTTSSSNHQVCDFTNARVLITDQKISSIHDLLPLLEEVIQAQEKLFIIADDITGEALSTLVINSIRGLINVVAIKAPSFGEKRKEILNDLCLATGAELISSDLNMPLKKVTRGSLGNVSRVVVGKDSTTIVINEEKKLLIDEHVKYLRKLISKDNESNNSSSFTPLSSYEKDRINERIQLLNSKIARIYVGALTETELKERHLRYEDAVNSVKCAVESGLVPGGGACLLYIGNNKEFYNKVIQEAKDIYTSSKKKSSLNTNDEDELDEDIIKGINIIFSSLSSPMKQIAENAGKEGSIITNYCKNQPFGFGYNALTDQYENLLSSGVVDPAKVTINAVRNAASIASLVLTTEAVITEKKNNKDSEHSYGQDMGGFM